LTKEDPLMADLIAPHGGLTEPVCRTVPAGEIPEFQARAEKLPQVPVSDADLSTVYRFGDGGLSPLIGPMDSATYRRVLEESVIEHSGKLYGWTIPLSLPVTAELASRLGPGQQVALVNSAGRIVATLEISDVFAWDKKEYLTKVYLTERTGRRHGAQGGRRQDAFAGRHHPGPAAAQASGVRQVRALAA
jgi:sulfate adenylyltransferase